jgi:hypothetical protein
MQSEVADVLRKVGSKIESYGLNTWQLRTLYAIKVPNSGGGHIDACDDCGNITISQLLPQRLSQVSGQQTRRLDPG